MDDQAGTRDAPRTGQRRPRARAKPTVRVYHWEWGPDDTRRPGLPWIGIFLLVFGGLLLIQQLVPQAAPASSLIVLAIGLAFLIKWAIDRGTGSLYAGAIITALAVPGLLNAAGIDNDGLSTFSFGVAFLFIALVRVVSGGGWGWQLWFGGLLALVGAANIAGASFAGLLLPIILLALGAFLLIGANALALAVARSARDGLAVGAGDGPRPRSCRPGPPRSGPAPRRSRRTAARAGSCRRRRRWRCRSPSRAARPARGPPRTTASAIRSPRGNGARVARSATSSMPTSRPRPRISPTAGWPPSASLEQAEQPLALGRARLDERPRSRGCAGPRGRPPRRPARASR